LHYYRVYFEKEQKDRDRQQERAVEWINRAVLRDPLDPLFWIKLADVFGMQEKYDEAGSILERLERDENSPQFVQQWLGYFLLFLDGREHDAIRHSLEFHRRFPGEVYGLYNAACGYAQLYTIELREKGVKEVHDLESRAKSLNILEDAIRIDPKLAVDARKHSEFGDSFESLASDVDFLRITGGREIDKGS
jgi:tetratricopeptide (TPR) repeat protein